MRFQIKDFLACCHQSKRSCANVQLKKHQHLSEYQLSQTSYLIQSQRTGKTEAPHDSEEKAHTFSKVRAFCSWNLGQLYGFKHKRSFPLKKACTSKATKSTLKDSSTASASLTPTRLPKSAELQSLVLEWLHGFLLQRHCINEFKLETISETQCTGKQK